MSARWINVHRSAPCVICGKSDWCSRRSDGYWAVCRRTDNGEGTPKQDVNGDDYWVYSVTGAGIPIEPLNFPVLPNGAIRAEPTLLNTVYTRVLQCLDLDARHRDALQARGLDAEGIRNGMYRSLPVRGRARIAKAIVEEFGEEVCGSIPGLYTKTEDDRSWWSLAGAAGLLIPVRSVIGLITALKVRADDAEGSKYTSVSSTGHGGPGPGAPIHVPLGTSSLDCAIVRVTEGELKADVAMALSGTTTISMPGVSGWRRTIPVLEELGAREVLLSFDADCRDNPHVARALCSSYTELGAAGFEVAVETWTHDFGKGIDDALVRDSGAITLLRGAEAEAYLSDLHSDSADGATTSSESARDALLHSVRHFEADPQHNWDQTLEVMSNKGILEGLSSQPHELRRTLLSELCSRLQVTKTSPEAKSIRSAVKALQIAAKSGKSTPGKSQDSPAQLMAEITEELDLVTDQLGTIFALIVKKNVQEVVPVKRDQFRMWLSLQLYLRHHIVASETAVAATIRLVEARAREEDSKQPVMLRTHRDDAGNCWYDLADSKWSAVRIAPGGWSIRQPSPVLFRRFTKTETQVTPMKGGDAKSLRRFINFDSEADWRLILSWCVAAFIPGSPRPILGLSGEQGAAKSTVARVLRKLIDPSKTELISPPKDDSQLAQSAYHGWILALDNVSHIPGWLSDALCRIVTGDAFEKRQLYTDDEDVIWEFQRPILINGIGSIISRPDLLDRALIVRLAPITAENRKTEHQFWKEFESCRAMLLGALFDLVARVLRELPSITEVPDMRLADFAAIGVALERICEWPIGSFAEAIQRNSDYQVEEAIESSLVAQALLEFMAQRKQWSGTASQLIEALLPYWGTQNSRRPKSPSRLSNELTRTAPALRKVGIHFRRTRGQARGRPRIIEIERKEDPPSAPSAAVRIPRPSGGDRENIHHKHKPEQDLDKDPRRDLPAVNHGRQTSGFGVQTAADGADGTFQSLETAPRADDDEEVEL